MPITNGTKENVYNFTWQMEIRSIKSGHATRNFEADGSQKA